MNLNGTTYYYEKDINGDIIGLVDTSGNRVVTYSYDSWGIYYQLEVHSQIQLAFLIRFVTESIIMILRRDSTM